jgi:chromate reductase
MNRHIVHPRVLGLPGSLRSQSNSLAVLRGLQSHPDLFAELHIRDLDLPLYNEDRDGDAAPEIIRDFRHAIRASDGVVIATPEYNHGIPGVLKNALDWASRPLGRSVLLQKPVLIISVSPAFTGGARAHAQANETLLSIPAAVLGGPQVVIGNAANKIADGKLVDEANLQFAISAIHRLLASTVASRVASHAETRSRGQAHSVPA